MFRISSRVLVLLVSISIVISTSYLIFHYDLLDRSTDFSVDMVKRIVIRYVGNGLIVVNKSDPRFSVILDCFNHVLDDVGMRLRMIYTDLSIIDVMNNSTYVEIYLYGRRVFKLGGEEVEASRIIVFIEGAREGLIVIDRGYVSSIHIWLCWDIDVSKQSFQKLKNLVIEYQRQA